jgi:hypothetical protein
MPLSRRTASRLEAILIVVAIAGLIAVLPRRYHLLPNWFAFFSTVVMVTPMLIGAIIQDPRPRWRGIERFLELSAVVAALAFNTINLMIAAYNLVENPSTLEPVTLFYTSVGIWTGNVLIFTLLYWLVDCNGPDARLTGTVRHPDFDFPAMDDPDHVPAGWQPDIVDYLFLAFTTSTAFSPTEAMPLTARAKLLMMLQSAVSLITIAIVAARTINILK